MNESIIDTLVDKDNAFIGEVKLKKEGDFYYGSFLVNNVPPALNELFREYEENVNSGVFSTIDALQEQILAYGLKLQTAQKRIKEIQQFEGNLTVWL